MFPPCACEDCGGALLDCIAHGKHLLVPGLCGGVDDEGSIYGPVLLHKAFAYAVNVLCGVGARECRPQEVVEALLRAVADGGGVVHDAHPRVVLVVFPACEGVAERLQVIGRWGRAVLARISRAVFFVRTARAGGVVAVPLHGDNALHGNLCIAEACGEREAGKVAHAITQFPALGPRYGNHELGTVIEARSCVVERVDKRGCLEMQVTREVHAF